MSNFTDDVLGFCYGHLRYIAKRMLLRPIGKPVERQDWAIGIYTGEEPWRILPLDGVKNPVLTRRHIRDFKAVFVADPFMIQVGGVWHMFFEVLKKKGWKGEIALATSSDGRSWKYRGVVLAEPVHLSYPYVFESKGERYMIPESWEAGGVYLYRAEEFPSKWTRAAALLESVRLVDTSVFESGGRWWMFACSRSGEDWDTLRLYSAPELTGPWVEHPQSPVISEDMHTARPAGRVQVNGDKIIRFAQDCSPKYGLSVSAFEVVELTPERYVERPLVSNPILGGSGSGWNRHGMHHIDAHRLADGRWIACVDGWRSLGMRR